MRWKRVVLLAITVLMTLTAADCKSDPHKSDPKKDPGSGYSIHEGGTCQREGEIAQKNGQQLICKRTIGNRLRWRIAEAPVTPDAPRRGSQK